MVTETNTRVMTCPQEIKHFEEQLAKQHGFDVAAQLYAGWGAANPKKKLFGVTARNLLYDALNGKTPIPPRPTPPAAKAAPAPAPAAAKPAAAAPVAPAAKKEEYRYVPRGQRETVGIPYGALYDAAKAAAAPKPKVEAPHPDEIPLPELEQLAGQVLGSGAVGNRGFRESDADRRTNINRLFYRATLTVPGMKDSDFKEDHRVAADFGFAKSVRMARQQTIDAHVQKRRDLAALDQRRAAGAPALSAGQLPLAQLESIASKVLGIGNMPPKADYDCSPDDQKRRMLLNRFHSYGLKLPEMTGMDFTGVHVMSCHGAAMAARAERQEGIDRELRNLAAPTASHKNVLMAKELHRLAGEVFTREIVDAAAPKWGQDDYETHRPALEKLFAENGLKIPGGLAPKAEMPGPRLTEQRDLRQKLINDFCVQLTSFAPGALGEKNPAERKAGLKAFVDTL